VFVASLPWRGPGGAFVADEDPVSRQGDVERRHGPPRGGVGEDRLAHDAELGDALQGGIVGRRVVRGGSRRRWVVGGRRVVPRLGRGLDRRGEQLRRELRKPPTPLGANAPAREWPGAAFLDVLRDGGEDGTGTARESPTWLGGLGPKSVSDLVAAQAERPRSGNDLEKAHQSFVAQPHAKKSNTRPGTVRAAGHEQAFSLAHSRRSARVRWLGEIAHQPGNSYVGQADGGLIGELRHSTAARSVCALTGCAKQGVV
jgi:hypothetical protein